LALFDLAVDSKQRGCDLLRLRIGQLVKTPLSDTARPLLSKRPESWCISN